MHKTYYSFCAVLVVLFLSAPLSRAQAVLRSVSKKPLVLTTVQHTALKRTIVPIGHTPKIPAANRIPLSVFIKSPEVIAARLERQIMFKQVNNKKRILAANKKAEKSFAMNTPVGVPNKTSQTGDILFRGVKIGELQPNEYLFMAGAYNEEGLQVASLQASLSGGQPVTIAHLEDGLLAYGIARVITAVRMPATKTTPKKLRIIDYNLQTGAIKTTIR